MEPSSKSHPLKNLLLALKSGSQKSVEPPEKYGPAHTCRFASQAFDKTLFSALVNNMISDDHNA